jgi:hypothetical protein
MRFFFAIAVCAPLLAGCESLDASRQDRCQRANWAEVGERDGVQDVKGLADRYQHICGDMFQAGPYKEGFDKGFARRPQPVR